LAGQCGLPVARDTRYRYRFAVNLSFAENAAQRLCFGQHRGGNIQFTENLIIPLRSSPFSALARTPGTFSRIQRILVLEKQASTTRPVFSLP
jgi:hypothetical protein